MSDRERRLANLSPAKRALLERERARRREARRSVTRRPIEARGAPEGLQPLSSSQERFWFLQQLEPDSTEYHVTLAGRLSGPLNPDALRRALADVVARHEILRTSFPAEDGVPSQRVAAGLRVDLPCTDLSRRGGDPVEVARREARALVDAPFDLGAGPLLRAGLLRLGLDDHVMVLVVHHILCDGWSLGVLRHELAACYSAHIRREAPGLPDVPLQFADYASWEREHMSGERRDRELRFWSERLAGAPPALGLPTDRPHPPLQTHHGASVTYGLGAPLSADLKRLARSQGATLFSAFLAAFDAFLARVCGEGDVVVGTSIANRDRSELRGLIGPVANTLALRLDCSGSPSFVELLRRARRVTAEAFTHPDLPFERLVEALVDERDPARSPVFNVFVDMDVATTPESYEGLELQPFDVPSERALFDLALCLIDGEREVAGRLDFNTDLFDRATIDRLWRAFVVMLSAAVADPEAPLDRLPLVDGADRQRVLHDVNATALEVEAGAYVHRLFERRARSTPDAVALEDHSSTGPSTTDGPRSITYGELDTRADRLAGELVALGVGPETRVAVLLPRSPDVIVSLLAIWKAGGAYVPLDPDDPEERRLLILRSSGAALRITRRDVTGDPAPDVPTLWLDDLPAGPGEARPPAAHHATCDGDLAYVVFTSGSTGRPKGVAVEHGALLNHVAWVRDAFDITAADRFLLRTPLTFDASLWEIVHPLVSGACLVVAPPGAPRDPHRLLQLVADARISVLQTVPSILAGWLDEPRFARCASLRHLICAGETLTLPLVHRFDRHCAAHGMATRLHNLYGPSEACIDASAHTCRRGADGLTENGGRDVLPIGRPISNVSIRVLDEGLQPVPMGVVGELFVGGAGLARGYLDLPDETALRFLEDPYGEGRLYRTGDLGRHLADGTLEFVGRRDHQIKLRGHRIELGEVELALAGHPSVREAVAVVDGEGRDARLLGYVVPATGADVDEQELRAHLASRLPRSMQPARIVALDGFPLTPSEKIDRRALPTPPRERSRGPSAAPLPATDTERRLTELMGELLDRDDVGVHDDFFALGGHSLLATRLAARVRAAWDVDVPLLRFFESPTAAALAVAVDQALAQQRPPGSTEEAAPPVDGPLSFAQQRLWFLSQLEPEAVHFNMPGAARLTGPLDVAALKAAFDDLLRRHAVLCTVFEERGGRPHVRLLPPPEGLLVHEDLSGLEADRQQRAVDARLRAEARHRFDLTTGPLLRARLLRLGADRHVLVLNQHHIVSDAWSLGVLADELAEAYRAHRSGSPAALPALAWQYQDFARWQVGQLSGPRLEELLTYWREALRDAPRSVELPTDRPRSDRPRHVGATLTQRLPRPLYEAAVRSARSRGTTPFTVLLGAFLGLLHRVTRSEDLVVATAVANRTRVETEPLIGFFVNTVALRAQVDEGITFGELVERVQRAVHGAVAHQDLPFERLVDALPGARDPSRHPVANVSFNLLTTPEPDWQLDDVQVERLAFDPGTSKLDLGVTVLVSEHDVFAELEYDTDLFDEVTIARLWRAFTVLLDGGLGHPERSLSALPLVEGEDRQRLLRLSSGPPAVEPGAPSVDEQVREHARATPDAVALVSGDARLDYRRLDARIDALTGHLRAHGVGAGDTVGLCLPRGVSWVLAMLATWRAGAAWVPLAPDDPVARRRDMLADAGARALITSAAQGDGLTACVERTILLDLAGEPDDEPPVPPPDAASARRPPPDDGADGARCAYVLFTSGSTGRPKGVEVSHRALANHTAWFVETLGFTAADRLINRIAPTFDAALLELLTPLAVGGRLILADEAVADDPAALIELGAREGVTALDAVPSLLRPLIEHPGLADWHALRVVFSGGERMPAALARRVAERTAELGRPAPLLFLYGPTEACVDTTSHLCAGDAVDPVPVGRPIAGASTYVVDSHLQLVPEPVPGELLVAGACLAEGYRGLPEATAAAFVADPFKTGRRAYRTGDLVRRRADGELVFLGRIDEQIKLRGQRLEPGEVESVLRGHPTVRDVAVTCADGLSLVAHVVGDPTRAADLAAFAGDQLPAGFVPTRWSFLGALPRTAHDKLDRRALEASPVAPAARATAPPTEPRTPLERQLTELFTEVLGADDVGVHDDFFARGGHSLLAIGLVARIAEACRVELPLREVFAGPTPARLAVVVGMLRRGESLAPLQAGRTIDLAAEVRLDDDIRPAWLAGAPDEVAAPSPAGPGGTRDGAGPRHVAARGHGSVAAPEDVLLTGATGFLGAFLLRELLDHTSARVHCLVRAQDDRRARARLVDNLRRYGLWEERFADRVLPVTGDLAAPRLGLDGPAFDALAGAVDWILHSGASVNFFHDYGQLEATNVGGTRELLRLACARRPTTFHFVSTIGVLASPSAADLGEVTEDVSLDGFADVEGGYEQSKWVAEQLVHAAARRGLPVAVYRPGRIAGHSRTGVGNPDDVGGRVLRGCLELGSAPAVDIPVDVTPVDYVAGAVVALCRGGRTDDRVYHLVNPERVPVSRLYGWARDAGHPLRLIPWSEWLAEVSTTVATDPSSTLYPLLPLFAGDGADESGFAPDARLPALGTRHVTQDLAGSPIRCPPVNRAMVARWLEDAARRGLLETGSDHDAS